MNIKKQSLSKVYLAALFVVFFAPLLFAVWLYFGPNTWLNSSAQNHGELFQPIRSLENFQLDSLDGNKWSRDNLFQKWTLLYLGDAGCDLYCEASLFKMRQVRLTLGRDSQRVQRIYLGIGNLSNAANLDQVLSKYPDLQVVWFTQEQLYNQLPQIKDLVLHEIFVIDPLGNLILRYSKHATAKGMQKDLKRLLKLSKIG